MITDEELVERIAKGDSRAFESLFSRHKKIVYGLSLRILGTQMLAEENTQDVWLKVVEGSTSFQVQGSVKAWILTITRNRALNIIRKRGWETELNPNTESQIVFDEEDLEKQMEQFVKIEKLKKSFTDLSEKQRVALVLWMIEELTYSEIAREMNISEGQVKALLFRAKEKLKSLLKENL